MRPVSKLVKPFCTGIGNSQLSGPAFLGYRLFAP